MYTLNAAWLAFAEQQRGSLRAGKLADFAVLDQDVLAVTADNPQLDTSAINVCGWPTGLPGAINQDKKTALQAVGCT